MKLERLLGITIYLLGHEMASARALAERFEVSTRTINRDMQALSLAGVPIAVRQGAGGGYAIMDSFRMDNLLATPGDYARIRAALAGMQSAYFRPEVRQTLEKMEALPGSGEGAVFVDLAVAREGAGFQETLALLERAIRQRRQVSFTYTNAQGRTAPRQVEPLALNYRWYAWYLLARKPDREAIRLYKLARMRRAVLIDLPWVQPYLSPQQALARWEAQPDGQPLCRAVVRCGRELRVAVEEYLTGEVIAERGDQVDLRIQAPEGERMWFSLLAGFGGAVEVLEPPELQIRLGELGRELTEKYPPQG